MKIFKGDKFSVPIDRLKVLEEKVAAEGIVLTEERLQALEPHKEEKKNNPDEIKTEHLGYLLAQVTFYVGYLKIDSNSSVLSVKVYTAKVSVIAADTLNDQILPFFDEQGVDIHQILSDSALDKPPVRSFSNITRLNIVKLDPDVLSRMAFVRLFIRHCLLSFIEVLFVGKFITSWRNYRKILTSS
ncbi:hypothetical protein NLC35_00300 [Candidatus Aminicenantes bacterium AC-334-K16]|jgi:hypothetical protein|nr:hypothetical protein [Candidatus Aminicenantes bacterium AC-334-K16]